MRVGVGYWILGIGYWLGFFQKKYGARVYCFCSGGIFIFLIFFMGGIRYKQWVGG